MGCTSSVPPNITPVDAPSLRQRPSTVVNAPVVSPTSALHPEPAPTLSLSTIVPVRVLQRTKTGSSFLLGFSEAIVDEDGFLPLTLIVDMKPPLDAAGKDVLYGNGVAQCLPYRSGVLLPRYRVFIEPLPSPLARFIRTQPDGSSPAAGNSSLACVSVFPAQPNGLLAICEGHGFGLPYHQFLAYSIQLCAAYEELQRFCALPLGAPLERLLLQQNGNLCFAAYGHLVRPELIHGKYLLSNACVGALDGVAPMWLAPEVHDAMLQADEVNVTHQWQWELGQALGCLCSMGGVLQDYPHVYRKHGPRIQFTVEHSSDFAEGQSIRNALKQRGYTNEVLDLILRLTRCEPASRCEIAAAKSTLVTALQVAQRDTNRSLLVKISPRPADFLQNRAREQPQRAPEIQETITRREEGTAQSSGDITLEWTPMIPGLDGAEALARDGAPAFHPEALPRQLPLAINVSCEPSDGIVCALGAVFVAKPTAGAVSVRFQAEWRTIFACESPRFLAQRPTADGRLQLVVYAEARREFHLIQADGDAVTRPFALVTTLPLNVVLPAGYPSRDAPVTCMASSAGRIIFAQGRHIRVLELLPNGELDRRAEDIVATQLAIDWDINLDIEPFCVTGLAIDEIRGVVYSSDNRTGVISTYGLDDGLLTANYFSARGQLEHCRAFVVDAAHNRIYAVASRPANCVHVINMGIDTFIARGTITSETVRYFPKHPITNLALRYDEDGFVTNVACSYMHPVCAGYSYVPVD